MEIRIATEQDREDIAEVYTDAFLKIGNSFLMIKRKLLEL